MTEQNDNLEPRDKEIGNVTYKVRPVPADVASRMMARLARKLVPALAGASAGGKDGGALLAALSHASDLLQDAEVDYFRDHFAKHTQLLLPDGRTPFLKDVINNHFAARMPEFLEWFAFCMEVNFGPFFVGLRARLTALVADSKDGEVSPAAGSKSSSLPTSTGESGASSRATS